MEMVGGWGQAEKLWWEGVGVRCDTDGRGFRKHFLTVLGVMFQHLNEYGLGDEHAGRDGVLW